MDMSDLFRRHFTNLHKGTNLTKTVQDRKDDFIKKRKSKRDTLAFARRNIDVDMSPFSTPGATESEPKKECKPEVKKEPLKSTSDGVSKRLEMLAKWKADKEKQKQLEKANKKPIFKVCHVRENLTSDLENVNKVIKGKSITKKSQFAPANHKFRPPKGIKPINFNDSRNTIQNKVKVAENPKHDNAKSKNAVPKPGSIKPQTPKRNILHHKKDVGLDNNTEHVSGLDRKQVAENPKHDNAKSKNVLPKPGSIKPQTPKRKILHHKKDVGLDNNTEHVSGLDRKQVAENPKHDNAKSKNVLPKPGSIKPQTPKRKILHPEKDVGLDNNPVTSTTKPSLQSVTKSSTAVVEKEVDNEDVASSSKTIVNRSLKRNKLVIEQNISLSEVPVDLNIRKDSDAKGESVIENISEEVQSPIYISPFVTISRGKAKAIEEFKLRRRSYGLENIKAPTPEASKFINEHTSPQAGAEYFLVKLESETKRINEICEKWENCLLDPELPEEAHSSIDVAIGQSKLLITKKFEQFRGLINQCKMKRYKEKVITCEDLHGFWDMVYMQVEDLDKRFANLNILRENNWTEIVPETKMNIRKNMPRVKKTVATSRLKDMIKAARKKQKTELNLEEDKLFNGGYFAVKTPLKEVPQNPALSASAHRRSLRVTTLTAETSKRYSSSPGLTIMKVSQSIKQGNGLTPAKSILKPNGCMSTGKKSVVFVEASSPKNLRRTVLFSEESKASPRRTIFHREEKENTPLRRSARLSKCV